ncbi:MAG: NUDIX hydrolase [Eisenbergiella porci]|nr:NUDIX hydrolase [Eisenbergiella porci]MDY2651831.1 NUDIX hydrolase [Eisenbergiella porci]
MIWHTFTLQCVDRSNMELWDAYDGQGNKTSGELIRGQEIPEGCYHLVSEVVVRHEDGSFLLMQRSEDKAMFPGLFAAGAGGSALKGEGPYEAAVRELKEETGIEAGELEQIYFCRSKDTLYYGYLCITGWDKKAVVLQEGETISFLWITAREFLEFVESEKYIWTQRERMEGYLDGVRNEEDNDCDFLYREF